MPSSFDPSAFNHLSREDLLMLVKELTQQVNTLESGQLSRKLLQQRSETLEKTYEAVHNGPLQSLAVLLRADASLSEPVRSQLEKISQDLRGIYQSMRLSMQDEALYLESGLSLDLDLPLDVLLQQVFEHTLARDFPGYGDLKFQITPDFTPLQTATLTTAHKRGLCLFLQEALCNVGKHAIGTTRLTVQSQHHTNENNIATYCLSITDNGKTPSIVESLLQSLIEDSQEDHKKKHQGTRQAEALAQQLNGKFRRCPNEPQGTHCELRWPCP